MDKQPTPVSTGDLEAALEQTEQNKEAAQQLADIEKSWSADWDSHRYDRDEQQPGHVDTATTPTTPGKAQASW